MQSIKKKFLKIFKINDGVPLMSAAFISIAFQSLLANVSFMPDLHFARAIIIMSNIYIIMIWTIAYVGINRKNFYVAKLAILLWSFYICIWIGLVALSMTPKGENYVCSYFRCPESMWLFNNSWHNDSLLTRMPEYEFDYDYQIKPVDKQSTEYIDDNPTTKEIESVEILAEDSFYMRVRGFNGEKRSASTKVGNRTTTPNVFFSATEPEADGLSPNGGHQKNGDFHYASSDLRSDRDFENVRPIRMPPKSSLVLNVLMIFVVSFTFGILAFGWLVLLSHILELMDQVKSFDNVHQHGP